MEDCPTCDYDKTCDGLKRSVAELEREKEDIETSQQYAEDNIPQILIVDAMPKITPASAKRETRLKLGTKKDINISLLDSRLGVSVARAAEDIVEYYGPEGEGTLPPEWGEQEVRNEIIDILQIGKRKYREKYLDNLAEINEEIKEAKEEYKETCIGDTPEVDLTLLQYAQAIAIAMKMKYKYAL